MVNQLDTLSDEWVSYDYSSFDVVVYVAGIVHAPNCKDWDLYKRVNADMPIIVAKTARQQGVSQFVFLSTMGVYGVNKKLTTNIIDENTPIAPKGMYSISKYMAEEGLSLLCNKDFKIVCVRPPSVYGKGCRGSYISSFTKMARRLYLIPKAFNDVKQSFIYIDNLCELIRLIIKNEMSGVFCPQDDISVSANELLSIISEAIGKPYHESKLFGLLVRLFGFIPIVRKAYGGIAYATSLSSIDGLDYVVVPFKEGMHRTVQ